MAKGGIRIIQRPPAAKARLKLIRDQIVRELKPLAEEHVKARQEIVSDFETEIKFGHRISATEKQITLSIVVENAAEQLEGSDWTVGELWAALDRKGTKSHVIRPKQQGGILRFQSGGKGSYQPRTRPIARSGGPGRVNRGETVYRRQVNHPGFPPRKFSETINKRLRKRFDKAVSRGVTLGWRKVR